MLLPVPPHVATIKPLDSRQFADREVGRTAWVLAGGPSLLKQDPDEMLGDCIFVVNHTIMAHDPAYAKCLGFPEPDYWIFGDLPVPRTFDVRQYPNVRKWCCNLAAVYLLGQGLHIADPATEDGRGESFVGFKERNDGIVGRLADSPLSQGMTVNTAFHLAWMMGCNPIHIRGLDGGAGPEGRLHWYGEPGEIKHLDHAKHDIKHFKGCLRATSWLIYGARRSGVTVTVKARSELTDGPLLDKSKGESLERKREKEAPAFSSG